MTIELVRDFLLWCMLINYGVLILWFLVFRFAHESIYRLHASWFALTKEQFDAVHYQGIAIYKIGILLFNLVPWIALQIMVSSG